MPIFTPKITSNAKCPKCSKKAAGKDHCPDRFIIDINSPNHPINSGEWNTLVKSIKQLYKLDF